MLESESHVNFKKVPCNGPLGANAKPLYCKKLTGGKLSSSEVPCCPYCYQRVVSDYSLSIASHELIVLQNIS